MREQLRRIALDVASDWNHSETPDCYDVSKEIINQILDTVADVTTEHIRIGEYRLPIPGGYEYHYNVELDDQSQPTRLIVDASFSQFSVDGRAHTTVPNPDGNTLPNIKICSKPDYLFTDHEVTEDLPAPFPLVCFDHQLQLTLSDNSTLTTQYDCLTSPINLWPYQRSLIGISTTRSHLRDVVTADTTPDGKYQKLHCKASQFDRNTRITLLQSAKNKEVFGFFNTESEMNPDINQLPIDQIKSIDSFNTEINWEPAQVTTKSPSFNQ
jgi:hypothetical protein